MVLRFTCFVFLIGITAASVAACGSDASPASADPLDAAGTETNDAARPGADGSMADTDAADAASPLDSGADAAPSVSPPNPPPGATQCAHGTLAPKDINDACKLPVSFGPPPAVACDDLTTDGGRYEVWCSASSTYVWVEIDNLRITATPPSCPVTSNFQVDNANYSFSDQTGAGAGGAGISAPVPLKTPQSFSTYATLPTSGEGAATIWLTGVDTLCPVDAASYGALVAGARVSWPSP